ncbi:MAG: exonuclease domain-containing protein [Bacteroidales bacterium]
MGRNDNTRTATALYAIVDIETTGGSLTRDKITEIAVFVHDGKEIREEFTTLINPERPIPPFITAMTGISNEMVADAPRFYEVAARIVELTEGKIFVAHNVSFDYHFIREEFRQLGYTFKRKQLCTVKLSRRLVPGLRSYSLGKICRELDIHIHKRHRAGGDAYATVKLFEKLLSLDGADLSRHSLIRTQALANLHPSLKPETIEMIPEAAGVYYFLDENGGIIYIGKSKNLYRRVITHLQNTSGKRAAEMRDRIADIDYEVTGSELVALLRESHEIKKHKPVYNRRQRRTTYSHGIFLNTNKYGYRELTIERNRQETLPLATFTSVEAARSFMEKRADEYELCRKLCGLYQGKGSCFQYQVGICRGACVQEEPPASYNERVNRLVDHLEGFPYRNFFILDEGRHEEEKAIIKIEHGTYRGYGYIDTTSPVSHPGQMNDSIRPYPDNRDVQQIIRNYLLAHKHLQIIPF